MVDAVILTDKWALDAEIGIEFQTEVIPLLGNYEDRNQDWPTGFYRFKVELKNRPIAEIIAFDTIVMGRRGRARTFLVQHPLYKTLTDQSIGSGDGVTAAFQITSLHADAANPYRHPWFSVTNLVVKVDGVTKTLTTHYTESNGLITFTGGNIPSGGSPPADITVSCTLYARVRFEEDYNPITLPIGPGVTNAFASAGPFVLVEKPI